MYYAVLSQKFSALPNYISPPFTNSGKLYNDVLARFTEPSNNDYNKYGSDNCDYNFGTFDDLDVKNEQQVYT